jgi:hypothetical protein
MKKSRVEILRGKLRRMGESDELHPAMPDDVADSFLAELRLDPDVGAIAARSWRPDNRNEQPWIREMFADDRRRRESSKPHRPLSAIDATEEPVN